MFCIWFLLWTGLCTLIDNCWAKDHSCSWQPHEWLQKPWLWWQRMGSLANESVFEGSPVKKKTHPESEIAENGGARWKWNLRRVTLYRALHGQEMWLHLLYIFNLYFTWKHCMAGDWFGKLFWEIDFHVSAKTIRKNFFDYL